jgi:hypothetical protein
MRPARWYDPAIRIGMIEDRAWRSILRLDPVRSTE